MSHYFFDSLLITTTGRTTTGKPTTVQTDIPPLAYHPSVCMVHQ
jgi:hypothetical protein